MEFDYSHQAKIIEIRNANGKRLISAKKIVYIKAEEGGSNVFMEGNECFQTTLLLKQLERLLPAPYYFRCHYSYILNCRFVEYFSSSTVVLKDNSKIPLARARKEAFTENLKQFLMRDHDMSPLVGL